MRDITAAACRIGTACLLAIAGGDERGHLAAGVAAAQAPSAGAPASRPGTAAMIIALPLTTEGNVLDRLADGPRAYGVRQATAGSLALPWRVTPSSAVIASERNFFGGDRRAWTALHTADASNPGLLGGYGIVGGRQVAWTWDGRTAVRRTLPAGVEIVGVAGPSDGGSLAADTYNTATFAQEILQWQPNGSVSLLYRNVQAKRGMRLFGMASNGILGAIVRDGILLTVDLYDGQWHTLPFDYLNCRCEALRVNASGQVLMTPLPDPGGNAQGYLVSRAGATLLPRADPRTRYTDLNDLGDVVGDAGGRPVVILDGVLHDLNAYANAGAAGWQLLTAVAINRQRQVLGAGLWQGRPRWYVLSLR